MLCREGGGYREGYRGGPPGGGGGFGRGGGGGDKVSISSPCSCFIEPKIGLRKEIYRLGQTILHGEQCDGSP